MLPQGPVLPLFDMVLLVLHAMRVSFRTILHALLPHQGLPMPCMFRVASMFLCLVLKLL
jgi:hypothetical protein